MFDLDGVVYIGETAVPGAPDQLRALRDTGVHVAFITNNASRPPDAVVQRLAAVGVEASPADVVTSAQAAAHVLRTRFGSDAAIAVLGAEGLVEAVREEGLEPRDVDDADVVAIVSGYGPDVVWRDVMRAAVRIRGGLPWVASNTDRTLPTHDGPAPGHGVLVDMIARFADVTPEVAGKPERPLLDETIRRVGGDRPLMVGDRIDTDIEGARNVSVASLLVMTGVTGLDELVSAAPRLRPTHVSTDLTGLFAVHGCPERRDAGWELGGWTARVDDGVLAVTGSGAVDDWWRVVATAGWHHLDEHGTPVDTTGSVPPGTAPER
ncbi:HAD-IIA family hydrolase [Nocardioides coralli]|nr:HAD-IIA family hydrolase [Nocardioides coralli]